jgi:hypothetical protein
MATLLYGVRPANPLTLSAIALAVSVFDLKLDPLIASGAGDWAHAPAKPMPPWTL